MIFIVVKFKPKPEYVESLTDKVAEFTRPPAASRATCASTGRAAWRTRRNTFSWKGSVTVTPARSTSPASTSRSSSAEPRAAGVDPTDHQSGIDATGGAEMGEIKVG